MTRLMAHLGQRLIRVGLVSLAFVLSGCATTRMIDSEVKSFIGNATPPRDAAYRFDRLPSQEALLDQTQVEAMAAKALAKAGPVLNTTNPAFSVQVNLQIVRLSRDPRYDPWMGGYGPSMRVGRVGVYGGVGVYPGNGHGSLGMYAETPWYRHRVHVVMRDLGNSAVVFESTALFEGPWPDSINIVPVLLDAALQGYPTPPQGPRIVSIELPPESEQRP